MDFKRLISVRDLREEETGFMFCRLANGDDVIVVLSRGMRHGNDFSVEQSKRKEPLFTVGFARVFGSNCVAGKYLLSVCEVNATSVEVLLPLILVPREHGRIVAT